MKQLGWDSLIVEQGARPSIDDQAFKAWMNKRPIFVSSVMDGEMRSARDAVRSGIRELGGEPIMWEEVTPRDERAEHAYLDGVVRSDVFVLLLGARYGIPDATGYSPTHKESNKAVERNIPRLLFTRSGLIGADRAGHLNDWLPELYGELSGHSFTNDADLTRHLTTQLREMAAGQETPWIKLGSIVLPAIVDELGGGRSRQFIIRSVVRDTAVRRAVSSLSNGFHQAPGRLTFIDTSHSVRVDNATIQNSTTSSARVEITCSGTDERDGFGKSGLGNFYINSGQGGQAITPADQVQTWARRALFGEAQPKGTSWTLFDGVSHIEPTLPQVLAQTGARGWTAEGIVRLYTIEGLGLSVSGQLDQIEVGPSTASSVRVKARFALGGGHSELALIQGSVPLA